MADRFHSVYRELTEEEKSSMSEIKSIAASLEVAMGAVKDPRMHALAITKLEEVVMWAVKGITG